jgi:phytoene synthase
MDDLDDQLKRTDPDRWLSSRFIGDAQARADVVAVYAFDGELARAPRVSNPLVGEMRLVWWREALDEIYGEAPVRRHPVAQALAAAVARRQLGRGPLEAMIDARYRELDAAPMSETEALDWARDTGGMASRLAAQVLYPAGDPKLALAPGAAWAFSRRFAAELPLATAHLLTTARTAARHLGAAAFPAVAHAALVDRPPRSELGKRLRLTLAVARGRI